MKRVISIFALFLIILLVFDRIMAYSFKKFVFDKTMSGESGGSLNYLINRKNNVDFLILGSSRAKNQINPEYLTNVYGGNGYNAGINGVGLIVYQDVLLDILVSKGVVPKTLILQIDSYQFIENQDTVEFNELIALYPFIEDSALIKSYIGYKENIKLFLHLYRYNGKLLNILYNYFRRNSLNDNNGYVALNTTMEVKYKDDSTKKNKIILNKFSTKKVNSLLNISSTCREKNIDLVVVLPPFFRNGASNPSADSMLIALLRKNSIKFLDLTDANNFPNFNSESLWKDTSHLNNRGAIQLTRIINDSLASSYGINRNDKVLY